MLHHTQSWHVMVRLFETLLLSRGPLHWNCSFCVWLRVRHYLLILHTHTSLHQCFSESVSTGVVWSYSLILKYKNTMTVLTVISFMIKESFIYLFASQCEMWFQENLRTDFVQRVMAKTVESFYARKMFFLCRENIFRLTTDLGSRVLLTLSMF